MTHLLPFTLLEVGSTGYKVMLLLHIAFAVAAYGPLFAYPSFVAASPTELARVHQRIVIPSQVLQWVFGMGVAGIGEWKIGDQPWLWGAIIVWAAGLAVSFFIVVPALKQGDRSRVGMGTGIMHLLVVVALWLMVFKPGL
jgi:hypothetical protein